MSDKLEAGGGMADVFLSYASKDSDAARQLAERLEAEGISVFYETANLAAGDSLDSLLLRTLRAARVVVVLWTEHSVHSSWVRIQAEQAVRMGKYIPFVVGPPVQVPYAFAHFPAATSFDQVVLAAKGRLVATTDPTHTRSSEPAKPAARDEPVARGVLPVPKSFREVQLAAVYWLGIGSAVLTLAGNLDSFIKLARWIRLVLSNWAEILTLIWRTLIPWRIHINAEDAVVLTLIVVLFFNLLITSRHKDLDVRFTPRDPVLLVGGALLIAYLGFVGFVDRHEDSQPGLVSLAVVPLIDWLHQLTVTGLDDIASFVSVLCLGVAAMLLAYVPFALVWSIRPNINAYAVRLWRILAGVGAAIVINQGSLFFEGPQWLGIINS